MISFARIANVRPVADGIDWEHAYRTCATFRLPDHRRHPGGQRHYYDSSTTNCAKAGTMTVTVLAGPLNYVGVNPKISCKTPQPSN
jgi:hypothetical protein